MNPEDLLGLAAGSAVLLGVTFAVLGLLIPVVAYWKILEKTGHPGPLALLFIFPVVGIILLYWLALAEWPALRSRAAAVAPAAPPLPAVQPEPERPEEPHAIKFCAGCGIGLEGSERFCRNCGRPTGA